MIKKTKKLNIFFITILFLLIFIFQLSPSINAQVRFCDLFPCGEDNPQVPVIEDPDSESSNLIMVGLTSLFSLPAAAVFLTIILSLFFTVFIGFGLLIIIKGALKIITAQSADEKVEEGYKTIRAVFIGLGLTFIGIIGIAIIISILGGGGLLEADLTAPEGIQGFPLTN